MSSAGISFGGLASGLDTQAIIAALVAVERRPITQLEAKKTELGKQKSLFGDLDGLLDKLSTAARKLKTTSQFLVMKGASSNEDVLTVAASSGATPGTHEIEVIKLAAAQLNHSSGSASPTESLGSYGEFTLDVGGTQHVISLSNPTLQGVADAINNIGGASVRAEVVDTGATTNPHQLVIRATETGVANGFSFSGVSGDAAFTNLIADLQTPANKIDATDAELKVNGITIFRPTNSVTGAIAGVTLDLKSTSALNEKVQVTISTDSEEVGKKIQEFVDAYNEVVDFFAKQSVVNDKGEAQSVLFGDSTLRSMRSALRSIVGGAVTTTGNPAFQMLAQAGVSSDRDGKLTFTQTELDDALATDEQAVSKIFTDATNGIAKRLEEQAKVYTDSVDGLIKTRVDGFDSRIKQADDRIDQAERRLELYQKQLETKYANLESLLSKLQGQGSSIGNIFQSKS
ncbi:MAG: flagellar filament capping protein FliD [Planctomycetes bacterium]|nr:flagellar filament capping protein FliD [Planctomycetota bacterium]